VQRSINGGAWGTWSGQVPAGSTSGSGSETPANPGTESWRNTCTGPGGRVTVSPVVSHTVTAPLCPDGSIKATTSCFRTNECGTALGNTTCGSACSAPEPDCLRVGINNFTAQPAKVVSGGTFSLTWGSSGADRCVISGVLNGNQTESVQVGTSGNMTTVKLRSDPSAFATYTLRCSNARYSDTRNISLQVLSPTITEF
jgi:hypothetical protein